MVGYMEEGGKLCCKFEQRLDTVNCLAFENEILEKVKGFAGEIVFDLEKVNYVASAFLRLCLRVFKEIGSGRFTVIHVSPEVKRVFKIAGFDKDLKIQ
ncbi:MAG TPA: STAS domain-containing protein [Candidatus Omnitrophota bacterium]|nr:STAS domain-containing protein [Candidatus Omnitrophota bacterium]